MREQSPAAKAGMPLPQSPPNPTPTSSLQLPHVPLTPAPPVSLDRSHPSGRPKEILSLTKAGIRTSPNRDLPPTPRPKPTPGPTLSPHPLPSHGRIQSPDHPGKHPKSATPIYELIYDLFVYLCFSGGSPHQSRGKHQDPHKKELLMWAQKARCVKPYKAMQ